MRPEPAIAIAVEAPIFQGGGMSVLARELIEQLGARFPLVLVSPDATEDLLASPLGPLLQSHIPWPAGRMTRRRARALADRIRAAGVALAHFHMGGNFAWGNRTFWTSPFPRLRRAGVRCLTTVHSVVSPIHGLLAPGTPWWKRQVKLAVSWLGRLRALASQECEIAVSRHDLQLLQRWYFPLRSRFQCIYHSRLSGRPVPGEPRQPMILHVGHQTPIKGQIHLLRSFAKIAARHLEWGLTLVGPSADPEYQELLAATVREAGLVGRVQLLGQRDDAEAFMRRAAVYVQPSLQEALGLALQEALSTGCACIGSNVGGIPELIEHERTGLLVKAGDESELASVLERLINDPAERERLGAAGAASIRARGMTAESMAGQYAALYVNLLSQPPLCPARTS